MVPKIILEGTRLTHKTDIAFALNEHPRIVGPRKYRYHSPLISAEWCAFTNFPWGRGLINFEPAEEALAMETYNTWVRLFELQRYYSWIIDRFHISTRAYQLKTYGKDYDFTWLEERLLPLGFRLVFVSRTPESFEAARAERLKVSGKPSQYDDLGIFVEEQALMKRLVGESMLPVLNVDISDDDVDGAVNRIADWLEQSGGLYLDDQGVRVFMEQMTAEDVLSIVQLFEDSAIDLVIDGGWGVDALLGEQTRTHTDLDIAIQHKDVEQARALLEDRGYKDVPRNDTRDCNFVLGDDQGRLVDFHTFTFDAQGKLVFGVEYPFESLTGSGSIMGHPVRCIRPDWMVKFHSGYKLDETDYHDVRLLCERFVIPLPEEYKVFSSKS